MPEFNIKELSNQKGISQEPSKWFTLSQSKIDLFADVTEDHQFIHVDPEKSKSGPFGQTIAHGFLSLSMLTHLSLEGAGITVANHKMAFNYGFDKIRFLAPVKSGSKIRGHFKLIEMSEKKTGYYLLNVEVNIEIEGEEKPALLAEWLTMYVV